MYYCAYRYCQYSRELVHFVKLSHQHPSTSEVGLSVVRDEVIHLRKKRRVWCIVNLVEDGPKD